MTTETDHTVRKDLALQLSRAKKLSQERPDDQQLAKVCQILGAETEALDPGGSAERADAVATLARALLDTYKLDEAAAAHGAIRLGREP